MGAALRVENLTLHFGGVMALDGVNLSLAPGTVLGLAGPNGSGKSTLVNTLTGHTRGGGAIFLDDRRIEHLPPADRARLGVARTFQTPRIYRRMTVLENLKAARHAHLPLLRPRATRRHEEDAMRAALAQYGLGDHAERLPDGLTPFQLRLLELARAEISEARLLLLDEPAAGATEEEAGKLGDMIARRLLPSRSVILIEHRMDLLARLCSEILVLQAGRTLAHGAARHVFSQPSVRACLLGEPAHA
jgi:ABC-type branched-subunit amino acid transport system ATPase component